LNDFDVGEKFRADKIIDEEMIFVYCLQTQKREKKKKLTKKVQTSEKATSKNCLRFSSTTLNCLIIQCQILSRTLNKRSAFQKTSLDLIQNSEVVHFRHHL